MTRTAALCVALLLAGCSDARLNTGISIGAGGASISPSVSGGIGKGRFSYSP